jgi:predicted nuclease of restriction endonuclease-like RecB superfamily
MPSALPQLTFAGGTLVLTGMDLRAFEGYPSCEALLARYNVAQVQVALFQATEMTVWATDDFKTIVRCAKLARLMHTIRRLGDSRFEIRLDGPVSVLRGTRRYGVALARFLPTLIACRGWRMHAVLQTRKRGWLASLDISPEDGLHSHQSPPKEFDSRVEEQFARRWGDKQEGWSLQREGELLHQGQRVPRPPHPFGCRGAGRPVQYVLASRDHSLQNGLAP